MSAIEEAAWALYCEETAGAMSARDFWQELSPDMQGRYIERVTGAVQAVYA